MNEARVAAVHDLELETPIELAGPGDEGPLKVEHELIQQRLVRAVVEKTTEVLIIPRAVRISCDTTLDPTGNGETRLRLFLLDDLGLNFFLRRSEGLPDYSAGRDRNQKGRNEPRESHAEQAGKVILSHG